MKSINYIITITLVVISLMSFDSVSSKVGVKCLIQLQNYEGEGAYCTVSLLDKDDKYLETLYVLGDDEDWYPDIENWFEFHGSSAGNDIDGITGASISVGKRKIVNFDIDEKLMDNGYKLRFETAVEDQYYYERDIEIPLATENFDKKINGVGYIRFIRLKMN